MGSGDGWADEDEDWLVEEWCKPDEKLHLRLRGEGRLAAERLSDSGFRGGNSSKSERSSPDFGGLGGRATVPADVEAGEPGLESGSRSSVGCDDAADLAAALLDLE